MDRFAAAAIRLPPVARLRCLALCAALVVVAALPAPAAALALPPPPVRLGVVWGRPAWSSPSPVLLAPPPGRWGAGWQTTGPVIAPIRLRSLYGRA